MRKVTLLLLLTGLPFLVAAQKTTTAVQRQMTAQRTQTALKIDGLLDEADWQSAPIAGEFVQFSPQPGAASRQRSEVRVLYDNIALYIGARLYDTSPDSIFTQMTERDELGVTDFFGVLIDAYQDGINGLGFIVTPKGIQYDTKYSAVSFGDGPSVIAQGDTNWDAVWDAAAEMDGEGWTAEIMIPYSAIRFPEKAIQTWNINFIRQIRRTREESFWNTVNPAMDGLMNQSGVISGLENIEAPIRLSATPFVVTYLENLHDAGGEPKNIWGRSFNAGMDIKYGLNDAFTLDVTLIPDFGEARSDNQVLNLSPFEVQFDENRAFFTEGVELFNKGNFFYSRRIGGTPLGHYEVEDGLGDNDTLLSNPARTQLINASKISGRTDSGLGIGVFNAVSARTVARIADRENLDQVREVETSPLTNYNVFVLDQNLKNNSYISLVNTNVWRNGTAYDANVTGTVFNLRNKQNSYAVGGRAALSQLYFSDSTGLGHKYSLSFSKTSGKFTFEMYYNEESDTYDPNDLGFLFNNNERSAGFNFNYNQYEPFGIYNEGGFGAWMGYERLYAPSVFSNFNVNVWGWLIQKNFFAYGMWADVQPTLGYDYFEPRVEGRYFTQVVNGASGVWISSDYRKKFALDLEVAYRKFDEPGRQIATVDFSPRYRFSDRFSMQLGMSNYYWFNDIGYVANPSAEEIIFGRRDRVQFVNTINAAFTFTNNMILTFRLRHYWQSVEYSNFYDLQEDGGIQSNDYDEFSDRSFNSFNIDAIYRWRFAPGSDFFVVWKNSIQGAADELEMVSYDYGRGFGELFELPQRNSLSLKLIYFLDYLQFKRR